jgi:hypothetical protein
MRAGYFNPILMTCKYGKLRQVHRMGSDRAGAGGGTTLRDIGQRSEATGDTPGDGQGAIQILRRHRSRPSAGDRKARRRRRVRTFMLTSAIILAGLVAGFIGGMISGVI